MVELHKPRWDGNSALRILTVAVAACCGALIQRAAPELTYVLPVTLVLIAIVLMARVTTINHGGLVGGGPEILTATGPDDVDSDLRTVVGRVQHPDHRAERAVLVLVDGGGNQVDRDTTDSEGRYRLAAPWPGTFTLLCLPTGDAADEPLVTTVDLTVTTTVRDVEVAGTAPR